jgi:hypothetical protein
VFGAALFHAMSNVSWQMFPNQGSHYDPRITGIIVAVTAVMVVATSNRQLQPRRTSAWAGD